jgi:hypothetical protein
MPAMRGKTADNRYTKFIEIAPVNKHQGGNIKSGIKKVDHAALIQRRLARKQSAQPRTARLRAKMWRGFDKD